MLTSIFKWSIKIRERALQLLFRADCYHIPTFLGIWGGVVLFGTSLQSAALTWRKIARLVMSRTT